MAMSMSVSWKKGTTNVANNTSTATLTVTMTTTYGSYNLNGMPATIKVTGNASYSANQTWTINLTTTKTMFSRTFTLNHDDDGTAKVTAKVTCDTQVSSGTLSKTVSYTAPTIARASEPSVTDGTKYLGSAIAITTNRKSSSFTHTLKWEWAGRSGTIAEDVGASYSWTPATATFAPYLTDATSSSCKITCDTYNGSTKIGSKSTSFTLAIPTTVVPTISAIACSDSAGYLGTYGAYVQSKSNVKATVTAAGVYGSTIASYTVAMDDTSANAETNTVTIGIPYNTGSRTVTATVVDTRGRKATKTTTISVAAYSAPVISASWAKRWNTSTGQEDDESTTVRVHAEGSVTNVNSKGLNKGTVKIEYRLSTASTWTQISSNQYTGSWNFNVDRASLSTESRYDFRITVTDSLGTVATSSYAIETARPIMDFLHNGRGVAIGGVSSVPDQLSVNYQLRELQGRIGTSTGTDFPPAAKYILIYRSKYPYNNTAIGGAIRIYGTIGGYAASLYTGYFDILVYPRDGYSASNAVTVLETTLFKNSIMDLHVLLDSSNHLCVAIDIKANQYAKWSIFFDMPSNNNGVSHMTWHEFPNLEYTSLTAIGTKLWSLSQAVPWIDIEPTNGRPTFTNHPALGNGIYLQGVLSSGSKTNILGMNSSNQVELNWTSGGMRGRVWKQLWSGTAASGSTISVPENPYYNIFGLAVSGTDSTIIAIRDLDNNDVVRGLSANTYVSSQDLPGLQIFACDVDVSGNNFILTRVFGHQLYMNGSTVTSYAGNNKPMSISRVYGII